MFGTFFLLKHSVFAPLIIIAWDFFLLKHSVIAPLMIIVWNFFYLLKHSVIAPLMIIVWNFFFLLKHSAITPLIIIVGTFLLKHSVSYCSFDHHCLGLFYRKEQSLPEGQKVVRINDVKLIDSGGGFYIEDQQNQDKETQEKELKEAVSCLTH